LLGVSQEDWLYWSCQFIRFTLCSYCDRYCLPSKWKKLELTEVMNIDTFKLELIQWILLLQDIQLLNEIHNIKGKSLENTTAIQPRKFGCGKGIFTYMADDFDVTPPGFEEYMLPWTI
jgi:hypothetical protein